MWPSSTHLSRAESSRLSLLLHLRMAATSGRWADPGNSESSDLSPSVPAEQRHRSMWTEVHINNRMRRTKSLRITSAGMRAVASEIGIVYFGTRRDRNSDKGAYIPSSSGPTGAAPRESNVDNAVFPLARATANTVPSAGSGYQVKHCCNVAGR